MYSGRRHPPESALAAGPAMLRIARGEIRVSPNAQNPASFCDDRSQKPAAPPARPLPRKPQFQTVRQRKKVPLPFLGSFAETGDRRRPPPAGYQQTKKGAGPNFSSFVGPRLPPLKEKPTPHRINQCGYRIPQHSVVNCLGLQTKLKNPIPGRKESVHATNIDKNPLLANYFYIPFANLQLCTGFSLTGRSLSGKGP